MPLDNLYSNFFWLLGLGLFAQLIIYTIVIIYTTTVVYFTYRLWGMIFMKEKVKVVIDKKDLLEIIDEYYSLKSK